MTKPESAPDELYSTASEEVFEPLYPYTSEFDPYDGIAIRPHPAKFSDVLLPHIKSLLPDNCVWITDPMAGVGKVTLLGDQYKYQCNELESEWAKQIKGADEVTSIDAKDMILKPETTVVTSPPYGNRMADCFKTKNPGSMKGRYAGDLGRRLSKGSAASLPFGQRYKELMSVIYKELFLQMKSGQIFILNVSNFIRSNQEVNVIGFYMVLFASYGFTLDSFQSVVTPRDRGRGANAKNRVKHEVVMKWRKL